MTPFTPEFLLSLIVRTAALTATALLVALLLKLARPASAAVHRFAWGLVLVQGLVFIQLPVAIPWEVHSADREGEQAGSASSSSRAAVEPRDLRAGPVVAEPDRPDSAEEEATAAEPNVVRSLRDRTVGSRSDPTTLDHHDEPDPAFADTAPAAVRTERHVTSAEPPASVPIAAGAVAAGPHKRWSWPLALGAAWLAGLAVLPLVWIAGYLRFVRRLPPGEPNDEWTRQWEHLLCERGVRGTIALRVTPNAGPMLCRLPGGYEVLVPQTLWEELDAAERRLILEHELAHYLRGDVWKSLAMRLLALPHWFNPLAWWAARNFDRCAEWACDEPALALDRRERISYAKTLLRLAERTAAPQLCRSAVFGSSIAVRVRRLVSPQAKKDTAMKKTLLCSLALGLVALSVLRPELVAKDAPAPNPISAANEAKSAIAQDPNFQLLPASPDAPRTTSDPTIPRDRLRYDGKSFREWRTLVQTELKLERRTEAFEAIGTLGANGYSKDAAEAIIDVASFYDFSSTTRGKSRAEIELKNAARLAFAKLLSEPAIDVVNDALREGNRNVQWFAVQVLTTSGVSSHKLAQGAIPGLIELTKSSDRDLQVAAIKAISEIEPKAREQVVSRLRELMNAKDNAVAFSAILALTRLAPKTEGLVDAIYEMYDKKQFPLFYALGALENLGPHARPAIPRLIEMLGTETAEMDGLRAGSSIAGLGGYPGRGGPMAVGYPGEGYSAGAGGEGYKVMPDMTDMMVRGRAGTSLAAVLAAIGKEAVQPLIEAYEKAVGFQKKALILNIFARMGPVAEPVIPLILDEIKSPSTRSTKVKEAAIHALQAVTRDPAKVQRLLDGARSKSDEK